MFFPTHNIRKHFCRKFRFCYLLIFLFVSIRRLIPYIFMCVPSKRTIVNCNIYRVNRNVLIRTLDKCVGEPIICFGSVHITWSIGFCSFCYFWSLDTSVFALSLHYRGVCQLDPVDSTTWYVLSIFAYDTWMSSIDIRCL